MKSSVSAASRPALRMLSKAAASWILILRLSSTQSSTTSCFCMVFSPWNSDLPSSIKRWRPGATPAAQPSGEVGTTQPACFIPLYGVECSFLKGLDILNRHFIGQGDGDRSAVLAPNVTAIGADFDGASQLSQGRLIPRIDIAGAANPVAIIALDQKQQHGAVAGSRQGRQFQQVPGAARGAGIGEFGQAGLAAEGDALDLQIADLVGLSRHVPVELKIQPRLAADLNLAADRIVPGKS